MMNEMRNQNELDAGTPGGTAPEEMMSEKMRPEGAPDGATVRTPAGTMPDMGQGRPEPSVNVALLAKWLGILFWVLIVSEISAVLADGDVTKSVPGLSVAGQVVQTAAVIMYGVILLKISSESARYRGAAICNFLTVALSILMLPVAASADNPLAVGGSLLAVIFGMVGGYYEFMGHSDVLGDVDSRRSEKWRRLWKWYLAAFLGIFVGTVLAVFIPILGMLVMLVCTIGMVVTCVLKIVYVYQSAKAFRTYGKTV